MKSAVKVLAMAFFLVPGGCERTPTGAVTPEPGVSHDGLSGQRVTRLRIHGSDLYALTDSGVYRRRLATLEAAWEHLGPDYRRANDCVGIVTPGPQVAEHRQLPPPVMDGPDITQRSDR
jgi:hypothetical protein